MDARQIGARVKSLRKDRGLNQHQLALKAKVGRSWLSVLETRGMKETGSVKLSRVAEALGTTVERLTSERDATGDIHITVDAAKSPVVKRLSAWSLDRLLALERMARIAFLEGMPPEDKPGDETAGGESDDGPDPKP